MNSSADATPAPVRAEDFPQWVREVRAPVPLPPKSCDCQAHIFGDPKKYPPRPDAAFTVYDATFDDLVRSSARSASSGW